MTPAHVSSLSSSPSPGVRRRPRPAVERAAADARAGDARLSLLWLAADRAPAFAGDADEGLAALGRVLRLAVDTSGVLVADQEDSFVVVLAGCDIAAAWEAAEALRGVVERHFQPTRSLTVSIGAACSPADADWTADDLVALSRSRCAGAMAAGGNRVRAHGAGPAVLARLSRWPAWDPADGQLPMPRQMRLF